MLSQSELPTPPSRRLGRKRRRRGRRQSFGIDEDEGGHLLQALSVLEYLCFFIILSTLTVLASTAKYHDDDRAPDRHHHQDLLCHHQDLSDT